MRLVIKKVPRRRRYIAAAILALFVVGISVTSATARTGRSHHAAGRLAIKATDSCGYSGTSTSITAARSSRIFSESTVAKGFSTTPVSATDPTIKTVQMFYSDEHALTLGTGSPTPFAVEFAGNAGDAGTNTGGTAPASMSVGDQSATDPLERPLFPALYLTDLGSGNDSGPTGPLATSTAGDWQNNGTAQRPDAVLGTWKTANASDPAKNGTNLGPNADAFNKSLNSSIEGYGAEVRWDAKTLIDQATGQTLKPGHWYRAQMIVHDGDQNKAGGDVGEACSKFKVPKPETEVKTDPKIKIQENVNVSVKVNTTTGVGVGASLKADGTEKIHVTLFKGVCSASTAANGGTRMADTIDIPITSSNYNTTTGKITANLTYPDNFTNATALSNGDYWWYVSFDETPDLLGSNDACTEQFNLNVTGLS